MSVNLKSLIGKLNDTTRGALEEAATAVPGAHALRRRDRTFSAEAAGREQQRCGAHSASVWSGCVAAAERTGAEPGYAEERQRADAGVQPFLLNMLTEAWTLGSLDFGADADSQRLRDAGAALQRRAGADRPGHQPGVAEDPAGGAEEGPAGHHGRIGRGYRGSGCRRIPSRPWLGGKAAGERRRIWISSP